MWFYDNLICLCLSYAANKSIISSKERVSDSFLSTDNAVKLLERCVDIVDFKYDLIHFNAEKDCSHSAVLTTIVRESCNFANSLKAVLSGKTAANTSLMVLSSCYLSARVHLASTHSIVRRSLSIKSYDSTNGNILSISRNCAAEGLQLCTVFSSPMFLLSNHLFSSDNMPSKVGNKQIF